MQYPIHLHCEPLLVGLLLALVATTRPAWFEKKSPGRLAWGALGVTLAMTAAGVLWRP